MLKLLRTMTKKEFLLALLCIVFILLQVYLELEIPDYMTEITTLVTTRTDAMGEILRAGGKMLLCALGSLASSVIVAVGVARIASRFGAKLRLRLFDRVLDFSNEELGRFSNASLITRSTNDVMQVQNALVMGFQAMVKAPVTAVWAILKIWNKNAQWTLTTGIAVALLLLIVGLMILLVLPKFKKMQRLTDDLNRVTRENLTGIRVVRAYNAEAYQEAKFEGANEALMENHLYALRASASLMPSIQLIMNGLSLAIYWLGAYLIEAAVGMEKLVLFSDMVVFSSYAMQVVISFMMLAVLFVILPRASVSAGRILEVLSTEPSLTDGTGKAEKGEGKVEFRKVRFRYPDAREDALEDISFTALPGQTLAFIGATGSGKTTVVNLIARLYDVREGEVLVDGMNVKDYSIQDLQNKIAFVTQKAVLFGGSIASNVAYGDSGKEPPTREEIQKALETAQAAEFVAQRKEGIDSYVAPGGTNLSGGQKQRMSIARAIARKPEIFIFDDSFSALDYRTDRLLRQALKKECAGSTRIIVAQRIGTILDADQIVVMEEGRVAGIGSHKELLKTCEVYRQIAYSQLSKEELE